MKLIAFTGVKGSGKDTAAAAVLTDTRFHLVKMADGMKNMLRDLLRYQGVDRDTIERMVEGDLKEIDTPLLGGRSPRYAMVTVGTEWGRDLMAPDMWVNIARNRCKLFSHVAISDIRFPNEVDMVRDLGGVVIRIERPGFTPGLGAHESERLIPSLEVDFSIGNTHETPTMFRRAVTEMLRSEGVI